MPRRGKAGPAKRRRGGGRDLRGMGARTAGGLGRAGEGGAPGAPPNQDLDGREDGKL